MYDYVAGKVDWFGAGWPRQGRPSPVVRLVDLVDHDVPTCRLDDRVDEVKERMGGGEICVVVNDHQVVLGAVRAEALAGVGAGVAADVMREGPSTWRPHLSARQAAADMKDAPRMLLTDAEGHLVGVVEREVVLAAAAGPSRSAGGDRSPS